ncbi:serine/threonine protein kinase [Pseudarthrobacter sp. NIBRBAC000502772]|uniref:serine/threonine-protein kinase n=1 Tax=Pseudarthrobacter sp. NIBRBAC000502772 TaxID=2590775 RepID=UPI0011307C32|nr:serine/threonine-protein kinase [Pseudarthrobacter sp. NIBRBAC000502772]QDG66046.1 serine/threonine protein kinase [Pseudarthrobacter sp. NIBRBAC000502772]
MVAESPSSIRTEVLGGRYRLGEVIGRGGMSSVYCARDENLGRDVALKLFAPQTPDADALKRQEAEITLLATLNHPSLVTLFDVGVDERVPEEPRPFLTMELVEGQDLRSRIRHSQVPLDELAVIGAGIADALAYVHGLGILHRDIKPGNILLVQTRPGEPLRAKVADFGIARIADATRLTATGAMVGTAAYLSPEQAMGSPLTPATDIYSLGLVLLECIKQSMEYPGSAVESAVARLHRAPRIPADLPAEWADLIRSMTAIEPLERPTAADIETALRQALVSPTSTPGGLAPETTRVLPAMPFRTPSVTAESPSPDLRARPVPGSDQPSRPRGTRRRRPARAGQKMRLPVLAILILVALAGGAAALTAGQAPESPPGVVPYPAVSGTLGDHLQELQKSVEP